MGSVMPPPPTPSGSSLTGSVHAGQTAVSGATIQLYAAGNTGHGSQATALLPTDVTTGANGKLIFNYICPSASTLIYLVAIGGNPGLSAGTNNAALAMMAALGACGSLGSSATVFINEVTTVASVFALAQFTRPPAQMSEQAALTYKVWRMLLR